MLEQINMFLDVCDAAIALASAFSLTTINKDYKSSLLSTIEVGGMALLSGTSGVYCLSSSVSSFAS